MIQVPHRTLPRLRNRLILEQALGLVFIERLEVQALDPSLSAFSKWGPVGGPGPSGLHFVKERPGGPGPPIGPPHFENADKEGVLVPVGHPTP